MDSVAKTPLSRGDVAAHMDLVIQLAPEEARSEQGYVLPGYERKMAERFVNTFADEEVE